ncbi:MAG TPA: M64 family metallopeptidase, partial [Fibrobacteria bacterium]|nr:M64 family metallopeptidase [Fibrobacteria bacterium]
AMSLACSTKILAILAMVTSTSRAFDCVRVQGREGGDRIRIVIYAEAYTEPMEEYFRTEVEEGVAELFSLSPWREYRDHFVIYRAWTPSRSDYLSQNPSDSTFFRSTFDGSYSRLPYSGIPGRIQADSSFGCSELSREALATSYSVIVVNLSTGMLVTGISPGNRTVLISRYGLGGVMGHELAHAFGGLSDEYSGNGAGGTSFIDGRPVNRPVYNIAASTDPELIPWKVWLDPSTPLPTPATPQYDTTIGLFLGADYSVIDRYKPSQHCMMRGVTWFDALPAMCVVCREALTYRILSIPTSESAWNPKPRIRLDTVHPAPGTLVSAGRILVVPIPVDTQPIQVRWMFRGQSVTAKDGRIEVADLQGGGTLEAVLEGRSPFIRNPSYLVSDTLRWTVNRSSSVVRNPTDRSPIRRGASVFVVRTTDPQGHWARTAGGRRVPLRPVARVAEGWILEGGTGLGDVLFLEPSDVRGESAGISP